MARRQSALQLARKYFHVVPLRPKKPGFYETSSVLQREIYAETRFLRLWRICMISVQVAEPEKMRFKLYSPHLKSQI